MQPTRSSEGMSDSVAAVVLAGVLGLGSGVLLALIAPSDKFSWAQLGLLPAWVILGVFFEFVSAFGATRRIRFASWVAVITGFYVAWFVFRAP